MAERPPSRGSSQPIRKRIPDDVTMTSPGDMLNDLIYYIWAICTLGEIAIEYPLIPYCSVPQADVMAIAWGFIDTYYLDFILYIIYFGVLFNNFLRGLLNILLLP